MTEKDMSQVRLDPNHVCDKDTGRYKARVRSLEAKSLGTLEIDKTQGPTPHTQCTISPFYSFILSKFADLVHKLQWGM